VRYRKGTVIISREADLPLIRLVHRAGHVTFSQVYRTLFATKEKRLWDTLGWRVRRMVAQEFLLSTAVPGFPEQVLSLGENGELLLQSNESFNVERGVRVRGSNKRHQIWHDVELYDIRLGLSAAGVVRQWKSEPEIRAENDFSTMHYAKDYDAIVTFECAGVSGTVALEYERTPKSSASYAAISRVIDQEQKIKTVLYLTVNPELHRFLLLNLGTSRRNIVVGLSREFVADPHRAELRDVRTGRSKRLGECLHDSSH
jgi:hypothetical protein